MKNLNKNKCCLVLLNKIGDESKKLRKVLKGLFDDDFKFFYFISNNLASLSASRMIKEERKTTKCMFAFHYKNFLQCQKDFDEFLPIEENDVNAKIEWAIKGCDAVIDDSHIINGSLLEKYNFELHRI